MMDHTPSQIREYREHNIVRWRDAFWAVPFGMPIDWTRDDPLSMPEVASSDAEASIVEAVDRLIEARQAAARKEASSNSPTQLGAYYGHNMVRIGEHYRAVPFGYPVDWSDRSWFTDPVLIIASDLADLKRQIDHAAAIGRHGVFALPNNPHHRGLSGFIPNDQPLHVLGDPELIEIEPIHTCNLRCIMCHVSYEKLSKQRLDIERTLRCLGAVRRCWVMLSSSYEPTAHPNFAELIQGLSQMGMRIDLTTNGSLLSDKVLAKISGADIRSATISFDGATKKTYENIRGRGNFDRTLARVTNFRSAFADRNTFFNVNNTVMRENLDEIKQAIDLWEGLDFDHMGLILMRVRNENQLLHRQSLEKYTNKVEGEFYEAGRHLIEENLRLVISSPVFNDSDLKSEFPDCVDGSVVHSRHPAYRLPITIRDYFQKGHFPGMQVDCRSPFKFARIHYNGDVMLCQKFVVGNIYERDFLDIWYGDEAERVRDGVRKPGNEKTCGTCNYYRFCIKAGEIDTKLSTNYTGYSNSSNTSDEDTIHDDGTPVFLGSKYNYRMFYWDNEYIGILDYPFFNIPNIGDSHDLMLGDAMSNSDTVRATDLATLFTEIEARRRANRTRVRNYPIFSISRTLRKKLKQVRTVVRAP